MDIIERLNNPDMCIDAIDDAIAEIEAQAAEIAALKRERELYHEALATVFDYTNAPYNKSIGDIRRLVEPVLRGETPTEASHA